MSSEMSSAPGGGKARLVLIGGFLGAGKTTAIVKFANYLKTRHHTPAVITNDYGSELVDSALIRAEGILSHAIEGSDLCSRSDEALSVAERLSHEEHATVIIAEPAGICADLPQTILMPARKSLGPGFSIAPLSVLIDPIRALRVLRSETGSKLLQEISTLYRKQIAEAEIVVINKSDLVPGNNLTTLRDLILDISPHAKIFSISTKSGAGLEEWFECLMTKETSIMSDISQSRKSADEIRMSLAWLNCTVSVSSFRYFDGGKLLIDLAACVQSLLQGEGGEIAHLKMVLHPEHDGHDICAVSLDRIDASPDLVRNLSEPIQRGELILNARAYGDPEILHSVVNRALLALMEHSPELFARMQHCEHFKAGHAHGQQPISALVGN